MFSVVYSVLTDKVNKSLFRKTGASQHRVYINIITPSRSKLWCFEWLIMMESLCQSITQQQIARSSIKFNFNLINLKFKLSSSSIKNKSKTIYLKNKNNKKVSLSVSLPIYSQDGGNQFTTILLHVLHGIFLLPIRVETLIFQIIEGNMLGRIVICLREEET